MRGPLRWHGCHIGLVDKGTMNEAMRPLRDGIEFKGFCPHDQAASEIRCCKRYVRHRRVEEELGKVCNKIYNFVGGSLRRAKDRIIVVDMEGVRGGLWGSEIAMTMMERGIEGVDLDGGCRDSYETNLEKAPVFCTKRTFTHAYGRVEPGALEHF